MYLKVCVVLNTFFISTCTYILNIIQKMTDIFCVYCSLESQTPDPNKIKHDSN